MPRDKSIKSVLIIGSGPIIIGQACEFDYSGTQAAKSLREEGVKVTLINSNPATIMTDPSTADNVYLLPLTVESIEKVLKEVRIDAVLPTMGGQTALNLCKEAGDLGIWDEYEIKVIGVDLKAIDKAEDREEFRLLMNELNIPVATAETANSFLEGKDIAQRIGFPLVIRPSYTLGGYGGGFVHNKDELDGALKRGLEASPTHEVLVEQAVLGWQEYEMELIRDSKNNMIIVCCIENFDAMGIHTGDSITVAPALTINDKVYQKMRNTAFKLLNGIGDFAGGCNIQFALNKETEELIAIEINPRVSRSSALASKATGYPIAKIAAKLALGYTLDELKNPITKTTSAFFEPVQDYVIVKVPRWNFNKFVGADKTLGLQMKSVGEVMGIGRSFQEALQKACQSLEDSKHGLGADGTLINISLEKITDGLENASDDRLFLIKAAFSMGVPVSTVNKITRIDNWYLNQIKELVDFEKEVQRYTLENIPAEVMLEAKQKGYSDNQLAYLLKNCSEDDVYFKRKEQGIKRVYKMVDTCSAEFKSPTNYFYSTFEQGAVSDSVKSDKPKVIILGSGPNRIGQGIEFDYCCVHGIYACQEMGYEAIMINCNPETVSTDSNTADKLYFEPVYWEHIREIIELEQPEGIIVQLGGQTALKLAEKFNEEGIKIIGTDFHNMDLAEDRGRFSDLLKELKIPYPKYGVAENADDAIKIANEVGYPVLIRPSYVLGGRGMKIVINDAELEQAVIHLLGELPGNRVLIDHFLDRAEEAECDVLSDGKDSIVIGAMEHIEPAGIHSGDSSAVLPVYSLSENVQKQMNDYAKKLAKSLKVVGLLNVQFAIKDETVYVIEANPRGSRTVPFICKAYGIPYVNYATKVMLGTHKVKDFDIKPKMDGYAIKLPVFSFEKFPNVNKELGPEMKSTGESIYFINHLKDPYFRQLDRKKSMYLSR